MPFHHPDSTWSYPRSLFSSSLSSSSRSSRPTSASLSSISILMRSLLQILASVSRVDAIGLLPLQECSGSFSLSGIKVQSTQMEEDVRLETLFVPIAKGLFDQPLDFIV